MNSVHVERLLPHRFPMLLVDRVLDLVPGESVVASKAITRNEQCYRKVGLHGADACLEYPQTLLIESWGQTAGILATWRSPDEPIEAHEADRVMLLGGLTGITFHGRCCRAMCFCIGPGSPVLCPTPRCSRARPCATARW